MSPEEAVAMLDALPAESASDVEGSHIKADQIILAVVPKKVSDAYERFAERAGGLWYA